MRDTRDLVPDSDLRHVGSLTALMRLKESEIQDIAVRRREELLQLSSGDDDRQPVTYHRLAVAMNLSDVAVYKILRGTQGPLRGWKKRA